MKMDLENLNNKVKETDNELDVHDDFLTDEHSLYSDARFRVRQGLMSRPYRLAAIILGLLSAVFLIIIIGLGVHVNKVRENQSTLSLNSSKISSQLAQLTSDHKRLTESNKVLESQHQEDIKRISYLQSTLQTETRLKNNLRAQTHALQEDKRKLKSQLTNLEDNCGQCLPNWVMMNSTCYFFAVSETLPRKTWSAGRLECTKKEAELLVINSKEEQEFITDTLKAMRYNLPFSYRNGFWMGLKDEHAEGVWKWLNGTIITEGYWMDGEPNDDLGIEDCAAVYPTNDPLKSWNDVPCSHPLKWICEKEIIKSS